MTAPLSPAQLARVAERFKALGEPARLRIIETLRRGEMTVSQLVDATGFAQANVSKHLQLLHSAGLLTRRKEGLFAYYGLADAEVLALCGIMCDRVERQTAAERTLFSAEA